MKIPNACVLVLSCAALAACVDMKTVLTVQPVVPGVKAMTLVTGGKGLADAHVATAYLVEEGAPWSVQAPTQTSGESGLSVGIGHATQLLGPLATFAGSQLIAEGNKLCYVMVVQAKGPATPKQVACP